jgi:uncharacterized repeat protein (TIGR03943 family)
MTEQKRSSFIQYLIVYGLALFLADKLISGKLSYYINSRFFPLTIFAVTILSLMTVLNLYNLLAESQESQPRKFSATIAIALALLPLLAVLLRLSSGIILVCFAVAGTVLYLVLRQTGKEETSSLTREIIPVISLIMLSVPLLIGVLSTEKPLTSATLDKRGVSLSASLTGSQNGAQSLKVIEDDRTILDWVKLFNYSDDHSQYLGNSANVIGFVYHDARLPQGQLMLSRFVITCCVADAFAIGMPVDSTQPMDYADNTWVNVKGTLDATTVDGKSVPMIHATSIQIVDAPEQPYLYP